MSRYGGAAGNDDQQGRYRNNGNYDNGYGGGGGRDQNSGQSSRGAYSDRDREYRDPRQQQYDRYDDRDTPRGYGGGGRDPRGGGGRGDGRDRLNDYNQQQSPSSAGGRDRLQEVRGGGGSSYNLGDGGGGGRDRMHELRGGSGGDNGRSGGYDQRGPSGYPPSAVGNSYRPQRPTDRGGGGDDDGGGGGGGGGGPLASFFDDVDGVQRGIEKINRNIQRIQSLQQRVLTATSSSETRNLNGELDEANEQTTTLLQTLRGRLRNMSNATKSMPRTAETNSRQGQQAALARKLVDAANAFQKLQSDFKSKTKARLEREIRIAKPGATPQEIERAIESGNSGFTQQLLSSRVADQRRALDEVQSRHEAIQKIERSMEELFSLFQEMQTLLEVQQVTINTIEEHAETAVVDLEAGSKEMTKAIEYRKSSRKKAWYIVAIVVVLLIIVGVVVYIEVVQPALNNKK